MKRLQTLRRQAAQASTLLLASTLVAGCASKHAPISLTAGLEGERHATMEVQNRHRHEVEVSVVRADGGAEQRVGSIDAQSNKGFRLPQYLNDQAVQVYVQCRVDWDEWTSHEIVWQRTQRVTLAVNSQLPLTQLALRWLLAY